MPQLSEIRYFVAAAKNGSLQRAAETLGLGQSCVSRKIMRLEEKPGVSLLERSNVGVRPTNAGQRYQNEVQPVHRQGFWDHWRRELMEALAHQGFHSRRPLLGEASGVV